MTDFAERLAKKLNSGLTPSEAARELGVSRQRVQQVMRLRGWPRLCLKCKQPLSQYERGYHKVCKENE